MGESTTAEEGCGESDLPEPLCYTRYDVAEALGDERLAVVGVGRFDEAGAPGLLMVTEDTMHLAFWDVNTESLEIVHAAEAPDGIKWGASTTFELTGPPAVGRVTSSTYDDVIVVSGGEVHHFPGQARGFGSPTSTPATDDQVESAPTVLYKTWGAIDVDGDGRSELIGESDKQLQVWRHQTSGWEPWGPLLPRGLYEPGDPWLSCGSPTAARVTDLDGDGRQDLVLLFDYDCPTDDSCQGCPPVADPGVVILRNTGGTPADFAPSHVRHRIEGYTTFLDIGDLDGDGAIDIIVALNGTRPTPLHVLMGRGDGTFADAVELLPDAWALGAASLHDESGLSLLVVPFDDTGARGVHALVRPMRDSTLLSLGIQDAAFVPVADLNGDGVPEIVPQVVQGRQGQHFFYISRR